MLGYANPAYAQSLAEFGTPLELPRSGGWVLEREIPGTKLRDAMGCYPLLVCRDWKGLREDLEELAARRSLISLGVVPDLFGDHDRALLEETFGDVVIPFKEHFITDMHKPLAESVSRHHRKYARKALQEIECDVVADAPGFLDEWVELHRNLVARHDAKGIRAYSPRAFAAQLAIPGTAAPRSARSSGSGTRTSPTATCSPSTRRATTRARPTRSTGSRSSISWGRCAGAPWAACPAPTSRSRGA